MKNKFKEFFINIGEQLHTLILYLTNNQKTTKDEIKFDVLFFMVNTAVLIPGIIWLIHIREYAWIAFLTIEYTWAWDNMRHNRE